MATLIKASKYRNIVSTSAKKDDEIDVVSNLQNCISDASNGMGASALYAAVAAGSNYYPYVFYYWYSSSNIIYYSPSTLTYRFSLLRCYNPFEPAQV